MLNQDPQWGGIDVGDRNRGEGNPVVAVRVSPDGEHLAWLAPLDGVCNLWVAPAADPKQARPLTRVTGRDISPYFRWAYTNRHLVFFQDHDGDENWRGSSVDLASGATTLLIAHAPGRCGRSRRRAAARRGPWRRSRAS